MRTGQGRYETGRHDATIADVFVPAPRVHAVPMPNAARFRLSSELTDATAPNEPAVPLDSICAPGDGNSPAVSDRWRWRSVTGVPIV